MVPVTINKKMTAGRKTMRATMIIIQTMKIMKIIHTMAIIDLEETDKAMMDHVMETTEATVSENGRVTGIGTTIGDIEMIMVKLKIMAIEETDQEETEMTIEMEEVAVTVEKGMTMTLVIPKREDVEEEMVILERTMKSNQRRERFIFRRNNLMMKIHYLETMYRWE